MWPREGEDRRLGNIRVSADPEDEDGPPETGRLSVERATGENREFGSGHPECQVPPGALRLPRDREQSVQWKGGGLALGPGVRSQNRSL